MIISFFISNIMKRHTITKLLQNLVIIKMNLIHLYLVFF